MYRRSSERGQARSHFDIEAGRGLEVSRAWSDIRRELIAAVRDGILRREEAIGMIRWIVDERLDLLPDGKAGIEMREYARERIEGVRCSHDLVERLVADGTMGPEYAEQFSARTLVERIQERSRAQSIIKSRKALQALMHEMEGLLAPDEVAFIESEPFPPYALHEANAAKEYVVNMRSLKTAGAVNSVTRIRALPDVRERMQAAKDSLAWSGRIDAMIEKLRQPASGPVTDSQVLKDDEVRMIRGLPSIAKRRDHVIRFIREKVLEYLFRNELSLADVEGNIL